LAAHGRKKGYAVYVFDSTKRILKRNAKPRNYERLFNQKIIYTALSPTIIATGILTHISENVKRAYC
jgi:hypothetical protein